MLAFKIVDRQVFDAVRRLVSHEAIWIHICRIDRRSASAISADDDRIVGRAVYRVQRGIAESKWGIARARHPDVTALEQLAISRLERRQNTHGFTDTSPRRGLGASSR